MPAAIKGWEISEEESCSDHNTLNFNLNFANDKKIYNFLGTRYIIKEQRHTEFYKTSSSWFLKISKMRTTKETLRK